MNQLNPGCIPACLTEIEPADLDFHIHTFSSEYGHDMVLDAPAMGCVVIDGYLLRGGPQAGPGLWESRDRRWRFSLHPNGDLLVEGLHPQHRCQLTVLGWLYRWTSPGRSVGIELEGLVARMAAPGSQLDGREVSCPSAAAAPPIPAPASAG